MKSCLQFEVDWLIRNGGTVDTIMRVIARHEKEWLRRLTQPEKVGV